jgi:hypothetical protein
LCLIPEGLKPNLKFVHKDGRVTRHAKPERHMKQLKLTVSPSSEYVSHIFDFNWLDA